MELTNIVNTTVVRVIRGLSPIKVFLPDLASFIKTEFKFVGYPQNLSDFLAPDKLDFSHGWYDDFVISKLSVYNDGVYVEAAEPSDRIDKFIDAITETAFAEFSLSMEGAEISTLYNSKVECVLKPGLSQWFSQLHPIIEKLSSAVANYPVEVSEYRVGGFAIVGEGPGEVKPGRFLLEPRVGVALSENIYFSEAPVSTGEHFALLADLEALF